MSGVRALDKKLLACWLRLAKVLPNHHAVQPQSPEGWRPFALRPFYLSLIAAIMILMFLTLEGLRRYTDRYGGLIFFQDTESVSSSQSFAYNYVPIIVALVLVILWSFIDFDVLRLEPYFQLARSDGVPASVLLINYNFGQTFITPLTSAKRGHWVVFLVAMLTVLIRMFLPALQSTLFELREVNVIANESMKTWPDLVNLHTQARWIAAEEREGFDAVDSVFSSRGSLRRSRSSEYAIAPVEIPMDDLRESTVWTVNQTIYWSKLGCQDLLDDTDVPVQLDHTASQHPTVAWNVTGMQLDDGDDNCVLDFSYRSVFFPETDFLQLRYWEPLRSDDALSSDDGPRAFQPSGCRPYDLYGVLISLNATRHGSPAISSLGPQSISSATMFACKVDYYKATAEVSMHANSSITSINVTEGTTSALTRDQFNIKEFQGLLSHRAPYTSDLLFFQYNETAGDRTVTELPVISQDLGDIEPVLVLDTSNIMGRDEFKAKVTRGVKQSFVLTMGRLFDPDLPATVLPALRLTRQVTITVVDFAALCSEAILAMGFLLVVTMLYYYHMRPNILQSDPGSIGAMCSMATDVFYPSNILADPTIDLDQFSTRRLRMLLRNSRLYWHQGPLGRRLEIVKTDGSPPNLSDRLRNRVDPRPHFLVIPIFILEFVLLAAVIAAMSVIIASLAHEGSFQHLTQSKSSFFQVVLSFLPSVVASAVGSLCNSIHRNVSILEPWVHLQRGMATARSSLSMNYATQTPWAVFFKTLRDRHVLLGVVSLACMANTILTVVAGGLFTQQLTTSYLPVNTVMTNYSPSVFRQTDFAADFTEYDLIQTSITSGVSMLPWTSAKQSFVPLDLQDPDPDYTYGATTTGIGTDLDCRQLNPVDSLTHDPESGSSYWHYQPFDNPSRTCRVNMPSLKPGQGGISLSIHFLSPEARREMDECQTSTVMVVGRWNYTADTAVTDDNTIALHCEPRVRLQEFSIMFDQRGQIQDYSFINDSAVTSGAMYDNATISLGQFNKVFAAIPQSFMGETNRNETFITSYDWAGFLVARLYKQRETTITSLNPIALMDMSQIVYQWVYSTYFSLWHEIYLEPLESPYAAPNATAINKTWAMVVSVPSLAIALVIIALDTLVVLIVFGTRRGRFQGPRIPRSIGAVMPWIANSRLLNDFRGTYSWNNMQRRQHLDRMGKRYGFRMFLGPDNRWRYAVEEEPLVKEVKEPPVSPSSLAGSDDSDPKPPDAIELQVVRASPPPDDRRNE
ncbi:hypothetical protein FE257_003622 [Aspergillus nanangensis]|uniref:Uncharacterized protein n=1 Tax=Aspergillus nanangensis TaxID=2582783 RepID=A0AAD4GW94_ASPNN|nr:hypothetical protein FE257_003622 [Aspergillus nanangensis]